MNRQTEVPVPGINVGHSPSARSHRVETEVRSLFSRQSPQLYYTRSYLRKKNATPAKAAQSDVRGPVTFTKELILLAGPNVDRVIKQRSKQKLYELGHIVTAFEFSKYWSEKQVYEKVRNVFSMKLADDIDIQLMMPCHNKLVKPQLMANQHLTGLMVSKIFKQKSVYIKPSKQLLFLEGSENSLDKENDNFQEQIVPNCETFDIEDSVLELIEEDTSAQEPSFPNVDELKNTVHQELPHTIVCETSNGQSSVIRQNTGNIGNQSTKSPDSELQPSTFEDNYKHYTELFMDELTHMDEYIIYTEESVDPIPNTDWNSDVTLKDVLSNLALQINSGSISKFNINRREVWDGACRGLRRKTFRPENRLSVIFTDSFGNSEGAMDFGGPAREFLKLLIQFLQSSKLFEGPENCKTLSCDAQALRNDEYFLAGVAFAISLVHGGPAPNFLAPLFYDALTCGWKNNPIGLENLGDVEAREILHKILNATSVERLQELVYENNMFLNLAGCIRVIKAVEDKQQLVEDYLHWYLRDRTMHSQERFKEGLKTLGVLDAMTAHPQLFKKAFIWQKEVMTSDALSALFKVSYSPAGSNARMVEERIIGYWRDFIQDSEEQECSSQLQDILAFVTGANHIPPLGLDPQPSIEFLDAHAKYPEAHTCANVIRLPLSKNYEDFKSNMDFGILNSPGFGRP